MGKYVKTYELFGLFKKRDKKEEPKVEDPKVEDPKVEDPKVEEPKKVITDLKTQFYDLVSKSIEKVKSSYHGLIEIESKSDNIDKIELNIKISSDLAKRRSHGVDCRDVYITIYLKIDKYEKYGRKKTVMYHPDHLDEFQLEIKQITSSDLKTSDKFIKIRPKDSFRFRMRPMMGLRGMDDTELKSSDDNIVTDENIEIVEGKIIRVISRHLDNLTNYVDEIIAYQKRQEMLDKLNSTSVDEITDIVSDLIDISDDYNISRKEEFYFANFKIKDLHVKNENKTIVLNRTSISTMKYLEEIQARIESMGLDIGVEYTSGELSLTIYQDELKEKPVAPKLIRRRAP